jgi:hypothetical protein
VTRVRTAVAPKLSSRPTLEREVGAPVNGLKNRKTFNSFVPHYRNPLPLNC